jgi:uncharacterized repeat protein (TIGR01451 family)
MCARFLKPLWVLAVALLILSALYLPRLGRAASAPVAETLPKSHDVIPPPPDDYFPDEDLESRSSSLPGRAAMPAEKVTWPVHRMPAAPGGMTWRPQGPAPTLNGQVENIFPLNDVNGAIHTIVAHPTDPDILYIGAVNGGIWRTLNATDSNPTWTALTDDAPSLSIGALELDPTDVTSQTLVAGIGRYSAFYQLGGALTGLLRTTDGGDTWTPITGTLMGKNVSGVAPRGDTIVVSVNTADSFAYGNIGIFRSTDGGASFDQISSGNGITTGLPGGVAFDLVGDPTDNERLFTAMTLANEVGGQNGVYRSDDTGATWTKVSTSAMEDLISSTATNNIEMAVGHEDNVYVAIINNGRLDGIFRSGNGGAAWTAMDVPTTNENGVDIGIQPNPKPGAQGYIHFSIVADPNDANLVYVGGDRQPYADEGTGGPNYWPNSIGAYDFSGRLFRGDASQPSGSQWAHLTHTPTITIPTGGTASSSAPHADSREMVFDADGDIIEVDDGGVYRRTSPQDNTGDWFSLNGDLQVTEFHRVAYDTNANVILGGTQDTGTPQQTAAGSMTWDSVSTADGGDVAVDVLSLAGMGQSIRYSSYQYFWAFRGQVYDAGNNYISVFYPTLIVSGTGLSLSQVDPNVQFYQPLELNAVDPSRGVLGTANVYETFDQFNTLTDLSGNTGFFITAMAYGGFISGTPYPDVLYYGGSGGLYLRTSIGGVITPLATYPGSKPRDIVLDPDDWQTAYVVDDSGGVHVTNNAGTNWRTITGDLVDGGLETCVFIPGSKDMLVVGGLSGASMMTTDNEGVWREFVAGLPRAPVYELDYDATDDVLLAGTLGRGAWLVRDASTAWMSRLEIKKAVSQDVAVAGTPITYTLTFSNAGATLATDVFITDTVPVSVTNVSVISSGVVITNTGYSPAYVWKVQDLAPGQGGVITITGQLSDTLSHAYVLTNAVFIATTAVDDPTDNSDVVSVTIDHLAPFAPTLLSPADGAFTNTTTLTLTWQASPSPDASGYLLDLNGTVVDVGDTTSSTTGVLGAGTYTWTVAAYDAVYNTSAYTDVWSFSVDLTPPDAPVLSGPPHNTVTNTTALTLTWQASLSPDVAGYLLDLNGMVIDVGDTTSSTTGVLADGIYTWTVAAYDVAHNTSAYTDTWSFSVDLTPPDVPLLSGPADQTVTSTAALSLTWQASPSPDVAGYLLDFDGTVVDVGDTTSSTTGVLADGAYTWTVAAYDVLRNTSAYTDVWSFTVDVTPPDAPVLSGPANHTFTNTTALTLTWQASASPDVMGYLLDLNGMVVDVGASTFATTGVLADGTYTWTVAAYSALHTSAYTDVWSFSVDATPPDAPVLSGPANGSVTSTTALSLTWQASPSPDVAGYLLDFDGTVLDVGDATFSSTGVLADGVYTWTVAAYDALRNTSAYTDVWSFTVATMPPSHLVYLPLVLNNYPTGTLLQNGNLTGDRR